MTEQTEQMDRQRRRGLFMKKKTLSTIIEMS